MAEATGLRNNALPYPVYGSPWTVAIPILDADGDPVTGATGLDSEISKNGDTFADCTNEATEIATSSGIYYLSLTGTELTTDVATIQVKTSSSGAKTTVISLYPRKLPIVRSGTGQSGSTSNTIKLDASASAVDDFYNGCMLLTTGGTGPNQARMISDYVGSTKVATVIPDWATTPDNTTTFSIYSPESRPVLPDQVADIQARIPAALTAGGNIKADALKVGGSDPETSTSIANAVGAHAPESGMTVDHALQAILSAVALKKSGMAGTTGLGRDFADTKTRATWTMDASGNVSAVTFSFD